MSCKKMETFYPTGFLREVLLIFMSAFAWSAEVEGSIQDGGAISGNTVVHEYQTPMLLKGDVIVQEYATLTLEPGVELRFAPGVMLAVNGTLIAKVWNMNLKIIRYHYVFCHMALWLTTASNR